MILQRNLRDSNNIIKFFNFWEETIMKKFVCPVCGYVYEGDEMPADFHCPVCKVPGSKFVEQTGDMKLAAEHEFGI